MTTETTENERLAAALGYAERGWRVHPLHSIDGGACTCQDAAACESPGKHPRLTAWQDKATIDAAIIRAWWRQWPTANVGIMTGAASGFIALDIDPRHGGDDGLRELQDEHGRLPATVESMTGGGGQHILFAHPGRYVKCRTGKDPVAGKPGVECKGDGGYIVAPPSNHASGNVYTWELSSEPGALPLAELPAWLLDELTRDGQKTTTGTAPAIGETIPKGQRNATLTSLAGTMRRRGMGEAALLAALKEENAARCEPPLPDDAVVAIAKSVARYAPAPRAAATAPASPAPSSPAATASSPATAAPHDPHTLADFAPWVNDNLERRSGRATKRAVAERLRDWLLSRERLLCDTDGNRPYFLTDDGYAIPLSDETALDLHCALRAAGLNPTEPAFAWLLGELRPAARMDGRPVQLARWSMSIGDRVYLSCGPAHYVLAMPGGDLQLKDNGDDGILFASDACLPEWDPTATPVDPLDLAAFTPALTTPPEVPAYTPEMQKRLLKAWLCALAAGTRPLPTPAILGDKDGGKTTLSRAILRLFLGRDANVTPLTADERDFWTVTTSTMLACFDNADAKGDLPWLPDALAVVATGGRRLTRKYYTDSQLNDRQITAAVIVNSRTATFARPDVAERLLPMLTTEMKDELRRADSDLALAVRDNRSGMLVHLAQTASTVLTWLDQAPEHLPARFLDFARVVWSYCKATDAEAEAVPTLKAWRAAQALAVGEADALLMAIIEKAPVTPLVDVSPKAFVSALTAAGADIPWLGGGKAIARRLRELRRSLELAGWLLKDETRAEHTFFTLTRMQ